VRGEEEYCSCLSSRRRSRPFRLTSRRRDSYDLVYPAAVRSAGRLTASTETTLSQGQLECENDEMCDRAAVSFFREDPIILLYKSGKQLAV
jgi:hypothetical protein